MPDKENTEPHIGVSTVSSFITDSQSPLSSAEPGTPGLNLFTVVSSLFAFVLSGTVHFIVLYKRKFQNIHENF